MSAGLKLADQLRDARARQKFLQRYQGLNPDQLLALDRDDWEEWLSVVTADDLEPVTLEACQRRSRAKRRYLILSMASVAAPLMLVAGIGLAVSGLAGLFLSPIFCVVLVSIACWAGLN
jgi:hypothetical protein